MDPRNKRIVKNSIFLLIRILFLALVGLYTVREVLAALGVEGFGLYNVIFGLVIMFTFINGALTSATQRYLSYEIGAKNIKNIKNIFLASFFIHVVIGILVIIIIFLLKNVFINNVLNVDEYVYEANFIYYLATISIFFSILQVPFSALITSYEKMDAFAHISIFEGMAKLIVVYLLYVIDFNKIISYAGYLTVISFLVLALHILYCLKKFKDLWQEGGVDILNIKTIIPEILSFVGWSLIGNLAAVFRNQGVNTVLNIFYGVILNAAFAIAMTVTNLLNSVLSSVSNAIKPQIFKSYAEKDYSRFFSLVNNGTRYYVYIISLLLFPLYFLLYFLLEVWLKNVPEYTLIFCQLSLVVVLIESYSVLIMSAIQATGKIKLNQIVLGSILLLNVPISYLFLYSDFEPYWVFYISILLSLVVFVIRLFIFKFLTDFKILYFFKYVFIPTFLNASIAYLLGYYLFDFLDTHDNFIYMILKASLYLVIMIMLMMLFLNTKERAIIFKYIGKVKI